MHTTEYRQSGVVARVWVIHNSDFSGETFVGWSVQDDAPKFEWTLSEGRLLLSGNFMGTQLYRGLDGESQSVPHWVLGRAVAIAVRRYITGKVIAHAEQI